MIRLALAASLWLVASCGESSDVADSGARNDARAEDASNEAGASACDVCACVRASSAPANCMYEYPPAGLEGQDPNRVRVQQSDAFVPRVVGASACNAASGGWFFDALPKPGTLVLCPATCDALREGDALVIFAECREPTE